MIDCSEMKILVLGSGGREHALCWKLAQSPGVEVFAAPGNPGIAHVATCLPAKDGSPNCFLDVALKLYPDLTVVGPEAPLVAGVVDLFRSHGLPIVGPDRSMAQLEASKAFAKNFFTQRKIPTARYVVADTPSEARQAVDRFNYPVVLKADGLAAGKGVVIARHRAEAEQALRSLAGGRLVIEEFLRGEEVSFIALCDGRNALPLEPTQDHKAAFDNDQGPNTGGMGAYCDSRILTAQQTEDIMRRIIQPTVDAMKYTGFLYAGLMMTAQGPKVLEFNVRLGDPETQPLMQRLESDLAPVLIAAANGSLDTVKLKWKEAPSICVVMASDGYPGTYESGIPIQGMEGAEDMGATVFQAGTREGAYGVETAGGRVLGVTSSGFDLQEAIANVYRAVSEIRFAGMHFRRDIGQKGLRRYNKGTAGT